MLAFNPVLLIPLYIVLFLLLLMGLLALLSRWKGGRYLRPLVEFLAKVPFFRRQMQKASTAAIERENPDLANAIRKLERLGPAVRDPRRAQAALSTLTPGERRAYMAYAEQQGAMEPEGTNRQMRRKLEKSRRDGQRGR